MTTERSTDAEQLADARRLLGWVYARSRFAQFSLKRTDRDSAMSDINYWTEPYSKHYTSPLNPQRNGRLYFGETP